MRDLKIVIKEALLEMKADYELAINMELVTLDDYLVYLKHLSLDDGFCYKIECEHYNGQLGVEIIAALEIDKADTAFFRGAHHWYLSPLMADKISDIIEHALKPRLENIQRTIQRISLERQHQIANSIQNRIKHNSQNEN